MNRDSKASIQYKFWIMKEISYNNYQIEMKNIIDKKIKIKFEKIKMKNKETNQILREEQKNLILIISYLNMINQRLFYWIIPRKNENKITEKLLLQM